MERTERLELAQDFLREAVYRSRARQATAGVLAPTEAVEGERSAELGNCGLGAKAAVVLDLDQRGRALFDELFGALDEARTDDRLAHVHAAMTDWIRRQDALDRKRNHFLKAFRHEHGFEREAWSAALLTEYEAGLSAVNDQANRELLEAAETLLARANGA